jgi:Icc-related predicted phosphoesterase
LTIVIVSDVHFEMGYFHGNYEYGALEWLISVISRVKPIALIGLGDWGSAWKGTDWEAVTRLVPVHAIYGNHDNMQFLQSARNIDGTPVLLKDGEVRIIDGFRFGFINGIMAERVEKLKEVPRKTQLDFLSFGKNLVGVDVLCTHESPSVPNLDRRLHSSLGSNTMSDVLEIARPRISFSGHVGRGCIVSTIGSTLSVIIDSSQLSRNFVLLEVASKELSIWKDTVLVERISFA